jgi:hypothetical protein
MASFFDLVASLQASIDSLDDILMGDENATVLVNGQQKPSVTKQAVDKLNSVVQLVVDAAADIDAVKYGTVSTGLTATVDGDFFSVVSASDASYLDLYKNNAGAAQLYKTYPSLRLVKENILKPMRLADSSNNNRKINDAIISLSLGGDFESRLITLSAISYNNGYLSIILASPDSESEIMSSTSNTGFVSRIYVETAMTGIKTFQLAPYAETSLEIAGEMTLNLDDLTASAYLSANYTANERLFDNRAIINLNGSYQEIKTIKSDSADVNDKAIANKQLISDVNNKILHVLGDSIKSKMVAAAIAEITFYDEAPKGKYFTLNSLQYSGENITCTINMSDDKNTVGTQVGRGEAKAESGLVEIVINGHSSNWAFPLSGKITVDMDKYPADNIDAAVIGDNATYNTRGINLAACNLQTRQDPFALEYKNQFNNGVDFNRSRLLSDYVKRSVSIFPQLELQPEDKLIISLFRWSLNNGQYLLTFQFKKMATDTQALADGLLVYTGSFSVDALENIKGTRSLEINGINGFNNPMTIEVDLDFLPFESSYGSTRYFQNEAAFNYINSGFDIEKVNKAATARIAENKSSGLTNYDSLISATNMAEAGVFSVGGNLFKPTVYGGDKESMLCINNQPKLLAKKVKQKPYDIYHNNVKIKLESIDSEDNFYFLNATNIVRTQSPLKQNLTAVGDSSTGLVLHDLTAAVYYSIPDFEVLFTNLTAGVDTFKNLKSTYDDELFIIGIKAGVTAILLTENYASTLRTFSFNGLTGNVYSFGEGVTVTKDWSMTHHGKIMFISDYDGGNNEGVRGTSGGQRCYVSTDNGYTFSQCLAFDGTWPNVNNSIEITNYNQAQAHIHGVVYDPKQNIVMVITGDGATSLDNSAFMWSRDLGQTWTHKRSTIKDTGQMSQMVNAIPFDGCMAFGSDAASINGVGVITYDGENMNHEIAKDFIPTRHALLTFARSAWSSNHSNLKYMSFGQDSQQTADPDALSLVCASSNGYTWETVWQDNSASIFGNVFVFDDSAGDVYISLDGASDFKGRLLVCKATYY